MSTRMDRIASIQRQIADENIHHRDKMRDLALARPEARMLPAPAAQAARLNRISQQEIAERGRHQRALRRFRERVAAA